MKSKMNKNSLKLSLLCAALMASSAAWALTGDTDKPVNINSENQALDLQSNVTTLTGNVVVTQGSIKITADKMVITRPGGDNSKIIIDAYGKPATFYQLQDSGKPVQGNAAKLRYEMAKDFIELTGNAYIEQQDSNIKGDRITYLVKEQKMQAYSQGQSKRVTTVLVPSQLQDKNGSSNSQKKSN
jgi:lipopolysaccharide export system protein LptA